MRLEPGRRRRIQVTLDDRRKYGDQQFNLVLVTDRGIFPVPVSFVALATHEFSPDSISFAGFEGEDLRTRELSHRAVFLAEGPRPTTDWVAPPELELRELTSEEGTVADAPAYRFRTVHYLLSPRDERIGRFKRSLVLRDGDGRVVRELPCVWERRSYISASQDRVALGPQPARVFLRCPDADVELTRVRWTPDGIEAAVTSTREVTIKLADDAPGVIDGVVEVETTEEGRPPLKVRVVRYAPWLDEGRDEAVLPEELFAVGSAVGD